MNDSPGDPFAHGWNPIPAGDHGYLRYHHDVVALTKALIPADPNGTGAWWGGLNVLKYATVVDDHSYWWIQLKVSHSIDPIYGLFLEYEGPIIGWGQLQTFGAMLSNDWGSPWTVWVELMIADSFIVGAGPETTEGEGSDSSTVEFSIAASQKDGASTSTSWSTTQSYTTTDTVVSLAQDPTKAEWTLDFPNVGTKHVHGLACKLDLYTCS